ncbi:MAG TPA: isoprenylcysteine carboxylmethyltransferase family protein [Rhodopseudomonas sp.]|uniref:methyltransferase family protein n=1 Tax=Rhodopseudomonas sp. TaxID=1078 RepID=UPI002ED9B1AD
MSSKHAARPNVLPWPPMLLAGAAVASILLGGALPLPALHEDWTAWLGGAVVLIGIALDVWAIVTMRRADTNILPNRAADLLVTWGPFRYSRNPIYLANTILLIGIGVAVGNYWFILSALVSALLVDRLAIRREEHHLAAKFGADWIDYSQQTPRWLF